MAKILAHILLSLLIILPHSLWAQEREGKVPIGVILPLSGRYKDFGEATLKGILLAAGIFGEKDTPVEILVEDSKGDPGLARVAVYNLYRRGAAAILGPLLSSVSIKAAKEAQMVRVPLVTFSQVEGISSTGDYIFQNSMTPSSQAKALAGFAVNQLLLTDFAILYPNTSYGITLASLFEKEVERLGGRVVRKLKYRKEKTDFSREIRRLFLIREEKDERGKPRLTPPVVDFEALFIPDYAERAGLIASQLAFYDVRDLQLLGTNGWHSPRLFKFGNRYVEGAVFTDGFAVESNDQEVKAFVKDFFREYGYKPGILEAQGYETMKILLSILEENPEASREDIKDWLLYRIYRFPGLTGYISFDITGRAVKGMYILKVEGESIKILKDKN